MHRKLFVVILVSAILITIILSGSNFLKSPIPNVSAVTVQQNIGVYWERNCSRAVNQIDWGLLSPGQVRDVVVYVRNEGNETFVLVLTPVNWNPENASHYLKLVLNCEDRKIEVGQVADVTLSLSVSQNVTGIYNFSVDMILEGREFFLGDVNRDGSVDVFDLLMLKAAMWSTPTDSEWNPNADLNGDSVISFFDFLVMVNDLGKSW